jgi:cell division protein FtsB
MEQKKSNLTNYLIALLVLFFLLTLYFWNKSRNLTNTVNSLTGQNEQLTAEVSTLSTLRTDLVNEIEVLSTQYEDMVGANDSLQTLFQKATAEVAAKKQELKKLKAGFAKDADGMKAEIDQLRAIKQEMSTLVAQIQAENETLKAANQELTTTVATVEAKNKDMEYKISDLTNVTADLEKTKKTLMAEATRATNIKVDFLRRGDKQTLNAKRVREVTVSFDLSNVPANKKGQQKIYIAIANELGVPVEVDNPVKATITTESNGKKQEIVAQQVASIDMSSGERHSFNIETGSRNLKEGNYRVSIYADWGLLGGAAFSLK